MAFTERTLDKRTVARDAETLRDVPGLSMGGFVRRFSKIAAGAAVIGLLATVAACGDDSGSGASAASTTNAPAASAATTATVAKATGTPIRLGLITRALYMPLGPPGAQAAIDRINAAGGVNGHPLELVPCSNDDKAATAATCAQKYVADPTIVATVGDTSAFGGDSNPPMELAKIAGVGTQPSGGGDFASPRVFPNVPGGNSLLGAVAFAYDKLNAKKIGMAVIDSPTAQALPGLVNANVLKSRGSALAATAVVPTSAADVSSQAASLIKSDAVVLAVTADLGIRLIKSMRQQGFTGPVVVSETTIDPTTVKNSLSPTEADKLYAVSFFDKTSAGYKRFLDDMEKYQPKATVTDLAGVAWLGANTFADVASKLPSVTRQSVWDAMNQLTNYDTGGMTAPLDYTKPGTALGGKAPRLFDPILQVYADVYKDGEYPPVEAKQVPIRVFS